MKKQKLIELFRFSVAGVQYSDYQKVSRFTPGTEVKLFWEKGNRFDSQAIRVEYNGTKIGYVPKGEFQEMLHEYREDGIKVKTTLVAFNKNNPTWHMMTLKCESRERKEDRAGEPSF